MLMPTAIHAISDLHPSLFPSMVISTSSAAFLGHSLESEFFILGAKGVTDNLIYLHLILSN